MQVHYQMNGGVLFRLHSPPPLPSPPPYLHTKRTKLCTYTTHVYSTYMYCMYLITVKWNVPGRKVASFVVSFNNMQMVLLCTKLGEIFGLPDG